MTIESALSLFQHQLTVRLTRSLWKIASTKYNNNNKKCFKIIRTYQSFSACHLTLYVNSIVTSIFRQWILKSTSRTWTDDYAVFELFWIVFEATVSVSVFNHVWINQSMSSIFFNGQTFSFDGFAILSSSKFDWSHHHRLPFFMFLSWADSSQLALWRLHWNQFRRQL